MLDIAETGQCPVSEIPVSGDKKHIQFPVKIRHSPVEYHPLPIIFNFLLLCLAYYYSLYISLYRISKFIA